MLSEKSSASRDYPFFPFPVFATTTGLRSGTLAAALPGLVAAWPVGSIIAIAGAGLVWLVALPVPQVRAAILLAALPTGTGPFMLAELYGRAAGSAARVVVLSTLGSIVTLTFVIAILR